MPERKKKDRLEKKEPGKLHRRALELAQGVTLDRLRDATGLPSSWLRKFKSGTIQNPSVNRIEIILSRLDSADVLTLPKP